MKREKFYIKRSVINDTNKLFEIINLLATIDLTKDQKALFEIFIKNIRNGFIHHNMFVTSGKAGTGKTVMLSIFIKICEILELKTITGAFTGKASQVLQNKGVDCQTLHSIMYKPVVAPNGAITGWTKNEGIKCDIFFVDEFSMLDEEMVNDILAYGIPVMFFGDVGQLPPVGSSKIYLEDKIDFIMDIVCRQAKGNPIIEYANMVREGKMIKAGTKKKNEQGLFAVIDKKNTKVINHLKNTYDQIVCGTNKVRKSLNEEYRQNKKYTSMLVEGERLMVLRNSKSREVFNGQVFTVEKFIGKKYVDKYGFIIQNVKTNDGIHGICVNNLINPNFDFNQYVYDNRIKERDGYSLPIHIDYAYAATCYKFQGDQAENVLVFADDFKYMLYVDKENGKENYFKALYTAITRASKCCVVVI